LRVLFVLSRMMMMIIIIIIIIIIISTTDEWLVKRLVQLWAKYAFDNEITCIRR
jgi:hypothetical protein